MDFERMQDALHQIQDDIHTAEKKSGQNIGSVRLCAVSKFHPEQAVLSAIAAGQRLFGENRVQEAYAKFTAIAQAGLPYELHIIGTLQSNKVKKAVEMASCIQSIDREPLLEAVERQASRLNKSIDVFFEIHTGEKSKAGYGDQNAFFETLEHCAANRYPHVVPRGLMTMAPFTEDEAEIRRSFRHVRELLEESRARFPSLPLTDMSMGMSNDFLIAIEEGSTMVRIGTAIFGQREVL